jgi:hypothetical protein
MALDELNEKLHSRDFHADRIRRTALPDLNDVAPDAAQINPTEAWQDPEKAAEALTEDQKSVLARLLSKKYLKIITLILGGIATLAVVAAIAMTVRSSLFQEENIRLSLSGPNDVASAESVVFIFEYDNDNWASLENATVVFEYPETFQPENAPNVVINTSRAEQTIGTIPSRGKGTIALRGKFYSYQGDRLAISAVLRYSPSSLSSSFEKRVRQDVRIVSSPIFFEIVAPLESAQGQEIQYEIRYSNNGTADFTNLHVKIDYPDGFEFIDANPRPVEGNALWKTDTLKSRMEGAIVIRGILSGERDQQKAIRGGIGFFRGDGKFVTYSEHERRTRVVASPFSISQMINGNIRDVALDPGDSIVYQVTYKNEGNVGIRDAILSVELDSPYLDYRTLSFSTSERGAYDQSRRVVSWKASDLPALARVEPGQGGSVSFSVATYEDLKERFLGVRELTIRSIAKIDSPDIPVLTGLTKVIASSEVIAKINSSVSVALTGLYQDSVFENSGPQPMVVGQETTYSMHYSIANTLNTIENGRASILLPTGIRYTGKRSPENERISFNERTNELIWDIGSIVPGTTREIVFQIAVVPEPGNIDGREAITFVNKALFTGRDSFTGKEHQLESNYIMRDTQ